MSATIRMSDKTKERFDSVGHYGDTADDILNRLIDVYKGRTR